METNTEMRPTKSAMTAIFAGLLVIALGYASYRYFNKPGVPEINGGTSTDTIREFGTPKNTVQEQRATLGASDGKGVVQWVATDYQSGDIKSSSYTVQAGDTLWEIAEAKYGSGFEWGKILTANSGSVGFLPNGSQALIVPGQVLVLP